MKVLLTQLDRVLPGIRTALLVSLLTIFGSDVHAADTLGDFEGKANHWAPFVEPGFPFFSTVLDARNLGGYLATNNLTPRGLILNLVNNCWACFDTELLRMSAIWEGKGITAVSMSQISYEIPGRKAPEGQEKLPHIVGTHLLLNGLYPGWQSGEQISFNFPDTAAP